MKWRGETYEQWLRRTGEWHHHFCLLPRQMRNGNWVWLDYCWAIRQPDMRGGWWFEFSDSATRPEDTRLKTKNPRPKG